MLWKSSRPFIILFLLVCFFISSGVFSSEFPSCQQKMDENCCGGKISSLSNPSMTKLEKSLADVEKNEIKNELLDKLKKDVLFSVNKQIEREVAAINCLEKELALAHCKKANEELLKDTRTLYPLLRAHLALTVVPFHTPLVNTYHLSYSKNIEHINGKIKLEPIQKHEEPLISKLTEIDRQKIRNNKTSTAYLNYTKATMAKEHTLISREIVSHSPHLIYFSKTKITSNDNELKKQISFAKKDIVKKARIEYEKLKNKPSKDYTFVFKYPHLVEDFLKRNKAQKNLCDVTDAFYKKYKEGGTIDLLQDVGLIAGGLLGAGACAFSFGTACGVVVAVGVEAAFLTKDQLNVLNARSLEKAQLIELQKVKEVENQRNMTAAFAPFALVGVHSAKSLTKVTLKISNPVLFKTTINKWLHYSPTTAAQNSKWINIAKTNQADFYIDIENAALKRLNDSLGDKNIVTSLTNLHKKILFEKMDIFTKKYKDITMNSYSDFKSSRFAFNFKSQKPATFEKDFQDLLEQINKEFDLEVFKIKELNLGNNVPSQWFSAGMGQTADQAGLISRITRSREGKAINFKEVTKLINQKRLGIESARSELAKSVDKSLLTTHANGAALPHLKVFEVLRKNVNKSEPDLIKIFKEKFNVTITQKQAALFKNYYREVDSFSPGLWVEKRLVANLDEAKFGGFSADFKGLGATNIRQVAYDLSFKGENLEKSLTRIRVGESLVTTSFEKQKNRFQTLVAEELKRIGVGVKTLCSGDDCVSLPTRPLLHHEEEAIIKKLATSGAPDALRISFIKAGVKEADRTKLAVHGELIEKELRERVAGFTQNKMSPKELENIIIAVKMPLNINTGKVELILAGGKTTPLTSKQIKLLNDHLKSSIEQVNRSLTQQTKVVTNYSP